MLIVLEGLDGAGKSTQLRMLTSWLEESGRQVEYLHFPRYDAPIYGGLISKFLRGDFGSIDSVHPQLVALLFAEDRRAAADRIREWLDAGRCVVLDRYVYSNIAFQCAKLKDRAESDSLRDWIFDVEYTRFGIPKPDINLFLDVPIDFVDERLKENREADADRSYLAGKGDIHEADINFQKEVRRLYREQCGIDPGFLRVDCSDSLGRMLPAEEIFARIRHEIETLV